MNKQYFKLALLNIKNRKLRSTLTLIGIIISIMIIIILISLSLGLQDAIKSIFQEMGQDKIFIYPNNIGTTIGNSDFSLQDANVVSKVPDVKEVFYSSVDFAKITANGKVGYSLVMGLPVESRRKLELIQEAFTIKISEGVFFKTRQNRGVVLGNKFSEDYNNLKIGDRIKIQDETFRVIGILKSLGNDADDKQVYISYNDASNLFSLEGRINFLGCQVENVDNIDKVFERITIKLDNYRNVNKKTRDYIIQRPKDLIEIFDKIILIVSAFLIGIGGISIFVGSIGIANTMFTSVLERTKEIGVMKAIGAKKSEINKIFLIESGILGTIGGVLGISLGYIISIIVGKFANKMIGTNYLSPYFSFSMIIGLLLFSIGIGIISGFVPAKRAAKVNIVEALRYE